VNATERLDQIEARARSATPGPWERDRFGAADGDAAFIGAPATSRIVAYETAHGSRDADFIAASRQDVPALVTALRAVLDLPGELTDLWTFETGLRESIRVVPVQDIRAAIESALGGTP
jgi:hypothetical protein